MAVKQKKIEVKNYEVLHGYRSPSTGKWHKKGENLSLTEVQARGLTMGAQPKLKLTTSVAKKEK